MKLYLAQGSALHRGQLADDVASLIRTLVLSVLYQQLRWGRAISMWDDLVQQLVDVVAGLARSPQRS